MTAATVTDQPTDQRPTALNGMIDRAGLQLQVPRDDAVRALALTFAKYPPGRKHAALVGEALNGTRVPEQDRPADQQAVRRLIARGQPAYRRAVEAEQERVAAAAAAGAARRAALAERLGPVAERDGQRAAEVVIDWWRRRGRPPAPTQLGRTLGWRSGDAYGICHQLIERGWLALDHRKRLQPGRRARTAAR